MKKLAMFLVLLLCISHTYAQTVSLETNIKDNDKEWPVCSRPTNLKTEISNGLTQVSWKATDDPSDYEIKLVQEQTRTVMLESTVSTNFISFDESSISSTKNYFIKVRRKCRDKLNNTIYSDWVVQSINNNELLCDCDEVAEAGVTAEYQQLNQCLLVQFDGLPCEDVEIGAAFLLTINAEGNPSYPQYLDLQGESFTQINLNDNDIITSVDWRWKINNITQCNSAYTYSVTNTNFDVDESLFDLTNCSLSNPCQLPQFLTATQLGDDVILNIDGLTQSEFDEEILGVGTAELHINGWSDSGYAEFEVPYYNVENNTEIINWEGVIGWFTGATEINVKLVYTDVNGDEITCTEEYQIPINVDSPYCDIIQLLIPNQIDDQSFSVSFSDPENPNYLTEELNSLGLTYNQAFNLFRANIREIRYKLQNTNQTIYVNNIQQLPLQDYEATFDPVQINEQFYGTVEVEYIFHDFTSEFCYITPITFDEEEVPVNELPEYECGSIYDASNITNQNQLDVLFVGDLVHISGITFRVTSVAGTNGSYSGEGELANPFTDQPIVVSYHSLTVNDEYQALTGEVNGEMGDPVNYPDFYIQPDTFNIGGEICLPPPPPPGYDEEGFNSVTGLNDRGFKQDSTHVETGTIYDPNGFDIDGNHETGGPFDEDGCDMYGYDENGVICEKDSTVVTAFIDSVSQTINTDVTNIVENLLDSLDLALGNDCSALRSEVSTLISDLQFDPKYIVGENNEYLDPGMSANFASEPHPLVLNTERDPLVKLLEQKHVDLYHCDKNYTKISELLSAIQSVSTEEIIELVKGEMKSLTNYQVDDFKNDPEAFQAWIIFTIEKLLKENYGITQVEYERTNISPFLQDTRSNSIRQKINSDYYATASIDEISLDIDATLKKENYWLFGQGRQSINGIDRALYLEELYNQMMMVTGGNTDTGIKLPIRIRKERDNKNYDIYLDELKITPSGASINATFIYTEPNSGRKLVFKAQDLAFGTGGILGESKLSLESFIELRLTNAAMLRINPGQNTFVTWDCTGFTSMGINADVELCRNLIIPLNPSNNNPLPDPERYKVNFTTQFDSWSDIYIEVNDGVNKPFAMAEYPDMIWNVSDITFDFSDHTSPNNVTLNPDYTSPHVNGSNFLPSWKGIHFGWIEVEMQSEINSNEPMRIGASDIIIDDTGVSGLLYGENVLSYENGNASGWQISVNSIDINVLQNHINGGSLGGKLGVPVFKDPMEYTATILRGGHYDFIIKPNLLDSFDIYGAEIKLDSNSYVQAKIEPNSEFELKATLHGTISINKELGGVDLKYNDIHFNNFEVSNISPYFSPGTWDFPNNIGADLYGFGINLRDITQFKNETDEKEVGLSTIVDLNLAEALGIKAEGGISIIGKMHEDQLGRQKWKYDRMTMDQFAVDAQFSAGHIKGSLSKFEGNNEYGKGFQGFLNAKFKGLGEMTAMGLFGSKGTGEDKYKYFFVDALVNVEGLGVPVGPLSINGFAGGASYHMDRDYSISNLTSVVNTSVIPPIGNSFSGTKYTPNSERGLGLKAGALISTTGTKSLFNGLVSFGILFNEADSTGTGGGVEEIEFNGMGQFLSLSPVVSAGENQDTSTAPNINSSLTTYIDLNYNFTDNVFDGKFNCFLNTPGDFIKGGMNDDGKMVDAAAYFSPEDWYIYLGTPSSPCKIALTIPGTDIGATVESYMDVGTDVPNMPPLPSEVQEIAHKVQDNQTLRSTGAGFVFGAGFRFGAHLNLGIASGSLEGGVGFDLMVRNFPGAYCLGNNPNDEIGINGWYSMGQMWAFIEGRVKILGVNVLSAGVAAVLQAQLPNPTFAQATVGVKVKVLFKTIRKSFKISIGESCNIIDEHSDSELGMPILLYMDPNSGTEDLEVDAEVRAVAALPINTKLELPTLEDPSTLHDYEVKIDSVSIHGNFGEYPVTYELSDSKTEIFINNRDLFYDRDSITAYIEVSVLKNGEHLVTESDTTIFKVGQGYKTIPESIIEYAYPIDGMHNFYPKEYNQEIGYLQLSKGVPELVYNIEDDEEIKLKLTSSEGEVRYIRVKYLPLRKRFEYQIPSEILTSNAVYFLEVVRIKKGSYEEYLPPGSVDVSLNSFMSSGEEGLAPDRDVPVHFNNEFAIYSSYFRVSEYQTFEEKLNNVLEEPTGADSKTIEGETFDKIEIVGLGQNLAMIDFTAKFPSTWVNTMNDKIYKQTYPIFQFHVNSTDGNYSDGLIFCDGDTIGQHFGYDVIKELEGAVGIAHTDLPLMSESQFRNGYSFDPNESISIKPIFQKLSFNSPKTITRNHWFDIKQEINTCLTNQAQSLLSQWSESTGSETPENLDNVYIVQPHLDHIRKYDPPAFGNNDKKVIIKYTIPGNIKTSEFTRFM